MWDTPSEVDLYGDCSEYVPMPKKPCKTLTRVQRSARPTKKLNVEVDIKPEVESTLKRSTHHNPALVVLKDLCVICQKKKTSPGKVKGREMLVKCSNLGQRLSEAARLCQHDRLLLHLQGEIDNVAADVVYHRSCCFTNTKRLITFKILQMNKSQLLMLHKSFL